MGKRLIFALVPVLFLGLALLFWIGLSRDPSVLPSVLIDTPAPDFVLPPLEGMKEGTPGFATADLMGQLSLVNVFASWCVPCRAEHPLLMRLAQNEGLRIIGINYKNEPDEARTWLEDLGNPYDRIGVDYDGRVSIDWGVYGIPETFVVDAKGRIRFKQVGPMTPDMVEQTLLPLIEELR